MNADMILEQMALENGFLDGLIAVGKLIKPEAAQTSQEVALMKHYLQEIKKLSIESQARMTKLKQEIQNVHTG